jgi:hypothetical protein
MTDWRAFSSSAGAPRATVALPRGARRGDRHPGMRAAHRAASPRASPPDASRAPLDERAGSSELWGPGALASARDVTTPLDGAHALMRHLRTRVGPYADDALLRAHLRTARGKLHWSANGYLRDAVLAPGRARRDFAPRPLARPHLAAATAAREEAAPNVVERATDHRPAEVPALPPLAWELVFARAPAADVCRLARVAAVTRRAASAPAVWRAQFLARWGEAAAARRIRRADADAEGGSPAVNWFAAYRDAHVREREMLCPECHASRVTPTVYGFPSPELVAALRRGAVSLGGDYLVEGDPCWACAACESRWRAWPFAWPDASWISAEELAEAGVSPWPGNLGGGRETAADGEGVAGGEGRDRGGREERRDYA